MRKQIFTIVMILVAQITTAQIILVPGDHNSIQSAIIASENGDTVLVAEGTYIENINYRGKAITVASQFILDRDTSHISRTIIDGSEPVYPDSGSTVTMLLARDTTSVLCGFTIQGGTGTWPIDYVLNNNPSKVGGGIIHAGGKINNNTIRNNQIEHNQIAWGGGISGGEMVKIDEDTGINIVIRENVVYNNHIHSTGYIPYGGGMSVSLSNGLCIVENNMIHTNSTSTEVIYKAMTGGVHLLKNTSNTGKAIFRNNYIHNNETISDLSFGGGLTYGLVYDSPTTEFHPTEIYNNIISDNYSEYNAGGICIWYLWDNVYQPPLDPILINNTVINNSSALGSGLCVIDAEIALINNILWDKIPEGGSEIFDELFNYDAPPPSWPDNKNTAMIHSAFNIVRGGWPGEGNIGFDPYFEEGTFQLSDSSFSVGRGVDSVQIKDVWYHAPSLDFEGNSRPNVIDPNIDIGAYESAYEPKMPSVTDLSYIGFINELLLPEFHKDSLLYELFVPDTITSPIPLQVVPLDIFSHVDIDYPSNLKSENETERTATITVTSSDSTNQKAYSVLFQLLSIDAALLDLTLAQGSLIPQFDPEIKAYEATLPAGTTEAPAITCSTSDEQATFEIFNAYKVTSSLENFRTSKVRVTSEYGEPFSTAYKIIFNVETVGVGDFAKDSKVKIYPNPTTYLLTIETDNPELCLIDITSLNGQLIYSNTMEGTTHQIDLSSFQKGLYFITIRSEDFVTTRKVIKL